MMKRFLSFLLVLALVASMSPVATAGGSDDGKNPDKQRIIEKLSQASGGDLIYSDAGGQIFLSGKLGGKQTAGLKSASGFLDENKALFGIGNVPEELKNARVEKDGQGDTFVKYEQTIEGVKVEGGTLTVHYDKSGVVRSVNGWLLRDKSITKLGSDAISEGDAVAIAKKQFTYNKLDFEPKAEKLIVTKDKKNYVAYKVNIAYKDPEIVNSDVYVEAYSGEVLKTESNIRYDGPVTGSGIDVQGNIRSLNLTLDHTDYYMNDYTRGQDTTNIITLDMLHGTDYGYYVTNKTGIFNTENDKALVSAHYYAGKVVDFYKNLFDRESLDDAGMGIYSFAHFSSNYNNAFWDGAEMVYGDGDGSEFTYLSGDLDVVGHEMTHGVIQYTADLEYNNQPGALNESMADVFGVLIETYDKYDVADGGTWTFDEDDWVIGDDIYTPSISGDALRSLADPSLYGQPEKMSEYGNYPDIETGDWGGVHLNSGIPNLAAYRIAQAIGMHKTADLYYRALTQYMNSHSDFYNARLCLQQAATDLYGTGSSELTAVSNAFDAAEIGAPFAGDPYEPNSSEGQAYSIVMDTDYQSYISSPADVDYYTFSVSAPVIIIATLDDIPASNDYDLFLFNENFECISYSMYGGNNPELVAARANLSGDYYLEVIPYLEAGGPGYSTTDKYTLSATLGVAVTDVALSNHTANLIKGVNDTISLAATVSPSNALINDVTWSSSNTGVATVDNSGLVTAVANGTATITATTVDGDFTDSCDVTVTTLVAGVSLDKHSVGLPIGASTTLTATVSPSDATNKAVTWSSSDAAVAAVNASGTVTAVGKGSATITVTTADGGFTDSCTVTVAKPVTGVSLDRAEAGMIVGDTLALAAMVQPSDASNTGVAWSSSNASVASVDGAGRVTALAAGTATIAATAAEGGFTAGCAVTVSSLGVPANVKASSSYTSIALSWQAVNGASGYEVYRAASATGAFTALPATAQTGCTDKGLTTNKTYYYKVRAYRDTGWGRIYGDFTPVKSAKAKPSTPKLKAAASAYNRITVSWGAVAGATKYELYRATSPAGRYTLLRTLTATSYANTGVSTGTTYYYKARAYRLVGKTKVYGDYSAVVSAKTKIAAPGSVKAARASAKSVKVSWAKAAGATKYEVWRSTASASTGFSLAATAGSASYTDRKVTAGKKYYYKVRAYRLVGGRKVYSGYSKVVSAKP